MTTNTPTDGWHTPPKDYVAAKAAPYQGERLHSQYVTVRDGIRLAVDVHLPGTLDEEKTYPAICIFTPY